MSKKIGTFKIDFDREEDGRFSLTFSKTKKVPKAYAGLVMAFEIAAITACKDIMDKLDKEAQKANGKKV